MKRTKTQLALVAIMLFAGTSMAQYPYGNGTTSPVTGVPPRMECDQAWVGRSAFDIRIVEAAPFASAYFLLSFGAAATTISGLPIWIDTVTLTPPIFGFTNAAGRATYTTALPNIPALAGFSFFGQGIILDGALPTVTHGLEIEITLPPLVAVGTSVGGSTDPFYLVNPLSGSLDLSTGSNLTNNCSGLVFSDEGLDLYIASSITSSINHVDFRTGTPVFSNLATFSGSVYGLALARDPQLLWALAPVAGNRELVAIDVAPGSPTYGLTLANTVGASTFGFVERWGLSPSGKLAAVLQVFGNLLFLYDTDPGSATFLQQVGILNVPTSLSAALSINSRVAFLPDDSELFVGIQHAGAPAEVARYSFPAGSWIDHDPGTAIIDNVGPNANPPVNIGNGALGISLPRDGSFAVIADISGAVGRLDFIPTTPFVSWLPASGASLTQAWNCAVNLDGTLVAVPSWSPPTLFIFDAATMSFVRSTPLPGGSNIYEIAFR